MSLADDLTQPSRGLAGLAGSSRHGLRISLAMALLLVAQGAVGRLDAAGGKVLLARKYRSGRSMIYVTKVSTDSKLESNPEVIKQLLPPMPTSLRLNQQTSVTVIKVHPDGAADVQHRFEKFDVQSDAGTLPDGIRESMIEAQQEVSQKMVGQSVTAHYDRDGRLTGFDGADAVFGDIDAPVRDTLSQMLRFFLDQMGGQSLYPRHAVRIGEEWSQNLDAPPINNYPFRVAGKYTLRYSGKTRFQGVKAAIIDFQFQNALSPDWGSLRKGDALPQLEAMGMGLDIQIKGSGSGRILLALDDGRVLQNHSTMHQTLNAVMKSREASLVPAEQLPHLEIQSDTNMEVEGKKP